MAGRWMMASIQTSFAVMPALVYLFAGLSPERGRRSAPWSRSRRCRRGCSGRSGRCSTSASTSRPRLALFDRVFEYLDLPVDIRPRARASSPDARAARSRFEDVWFRYDDRTPWTLRDIDLDVPAGTRTALVGETGSGKTTLGYLAARLYDPPSAARCRSTASTSAT